MPKLDETHDAARKSWVESANDGKTDFPIQNLPYGAFRHGGGIARGGVAIGDRIFDLGTASKADLFSGDAKLAAQAASGPTLNPLMALGRRYSSALRQQLSDLLRADNPDREKLGGMEGLLVPIADAQLQMPASVGAFTDFMVSIYHTERAGRASRPDNPIPENFKHLPIAYNSRASSVRVSGEAVVRSNGQFRAGNEVVFGPCRALDFELEIGIFVGPGNTLGSPIPMARAPEQIFGYCLLNDWSARDVQRWEMFPLGPFLSKSLSTTISPWIVTAEALAPFAAPAFARPAGDPEPLPYLSSAEDKAEGGLDIGLEAHLTTARMRESGAAPARITRTNATALYWTPAQIVTHHASNGCNIQPGDILATGTVSGPTDESRACLVELTERGTKPIALPDGEERRFLEDGDEVTFTARAEREGFVSIGFGECRARIDPAPAWPTA